jgi:hypothetical protein
VKGSLLALCGLGGVALCLYAQTLPDPGQSLLVIVAQFMVALPFGYMTGKAANR